MYNNDFYSSLTKPSYTPKGVVFMVVWPILYLLMLVSLLIVIFSISSLKSMAIWLFAIQLVLNLAWSPVFFALKQIRPALMISLVMTFCVLLMLLVFMEISKLAGILQIPYLLWLCFASFLNYKIIMLNPTK